MRSASVAAALTLALAVPAVLPAAAETTPPSPSPTPIELGGTPVEVSTDANAPTVLTAGLWSDTLSGPGTADANAHRFRYERTMADSTVVVAAVATSPEESGDEVAIAVTTPDGSTCGENYSTQGLPARASAVGAIVVVPSGEYGVLDDACLRSDVVDITLTRGRTDLPGELPVALRIVEEAPVTDAEADLPPVLDEPAVTAPRPGEPSEVAGGSTFDDAPDLTPGTYADSVREGTERLYRVRLDWGQALAVRVDVPPQSPADEVTLESSADPTLNLTLVDPVLNTFDGGAADAADDVTYDTEGGTAFDGTLPVAYLNRFDSGTMLLPGDYWVSLAVGATAGHEPVDVPVELTVEVVGEPGPPPTFAPTVQAPGRQPGPPSYDPATPYLIGADQFAADVAGTPRAPEGAPGGAGGGDAAGSSTSGRQVAGGVVGALSLLCLLAGVVLLRRRALIR